MDQNIIQINGEITINRNPSTCSCENGEYLASIIANQKIICDETIDVEANSTDS